MNSVSNPFSAKDCALCLDPLLGTAMVTTSCGHKFHLQCLSDILKGKKENQLCPICRHPLNSEMKDIDFVTSNIHATLPDYSRPISSQPMRIENSFADDEPIPDLVAVVAPVNNDQHNLLSCSLHSSTSTTHIPNPTPFYLAVSLVADGASNHARPNVDFVALVDTSTSMTGAKISSVKSMLRLLALDLLQDGDRLCIVSFNTNSSRIMPLTRTSPKNRDYFVRSIERLTLSGGTRAMPGIELALSVLSSRRQRNQISAILILSDGQDTQYPGSQFGAELARRLVLHAEEARDLVIHSFGFGANHDVEMMRTAAVAANGTFNYIHSSVDMRAGVAGCIGGILDTCCRNIDISVSLPTGWIVGEVMTTYETSIVAASDVSGVTAVIVRIPDIYIGERRDIPILISVTERFRNDLLLHSEAGLDQEITAIVRYESLLSREISPVAVELKLTHSWTIDVRPTTPNFLLDKQINRYMAAKALDQARILADKQKTTEAAFVLQEAQARIMQSISFNDPDVGMLCRDLLRFGGIVNSGNISNASVAQMHSIGSQHCSQRSVYVKGDQGELAMRPYASPTSTSFSIIADGKATDLK